MSDGSDFHTIIRARRSTRKFQPGRTIDRAALERIVDCGRWAPTGANTQCTEFIVIDDPDRIAEVTEIFLAQAQRLVDHAKGFPAVKKTYLAHTVAIIIVLGDPRWKVCFPQPTTEAMAAEYHDNNDAIFLASLGAAIQNIQLGVTAEGFTSAWLSGGGEETTNAALSKALGYPEWMVAYGTIPIGVPVAEQDSRYRRPLAQCLHWNGYEPKQMRPHDQVDVYESTLRPFAMYRDQATMEAWPDRAEKLGAWDAAFTGAHPNPTGEIPEAADFSKPRSMGRATKARQRGKTD